MNAIQAISRAINSSTGWIGVLLGDFSDAELLVRPVPNANHAAWQLGNVIAGDSYLIKMLFPDAEFPPLAEGFVALHGREGIGKDQDPGFLTKDGYLKLLSETRAATVAALARLSETDLDKPLPESLRFCGENVGDLFQFVATHTLMHLGQFSVIRRKLGKAVLF